MTKEEKDRLRKGAWILKKELNKKKLGKKDRKELWDRFLENQEEKFRKLVGGIG